LGYYQLMLAWFLSPPTILVMPAVSGIGGSAGKPKTITKKFAPRHVVLELAGKTVP
jgi:hypothetical protein